MMPYLHSCEKRCPGSFNTLLRKYLVAMATEDLTLLVLLFKASKADVSPSIFDTFFVFNRIWSCQMMITGQLMNYHVSLQNVSVQICIMKCIFISSPTSSYCWVNGWTWVIQFPLGPFSSIWSSISRTSGDQWKVYWPNIHPATQLSVSKHWRIAAPADCLERTFFKILLQLLTACEFSVWNIFFWCSVKISSNDYELTVLHDKDFIIIRPYHSHIVHRCGLVLEMSLIVVCVYACVFVCVWLCGATVNPAKMAEKIEVPFGM